MKLKVRIDRGNKDDVIKALKVEPIFIKDEYVENIDNSDFFDWDNLYFAKIGDYYLSDIDYGYVLEYEADSNSNNPIDYNEVVIGIGLSSLDDDAIDIEQWEFEHLQNALKNEIEIIR